MGRKKVGLEGFKDPYALLAYNVLYAYAFSGREDGEMLVNQFLNKIEKSDFWIGVLKNRKKLFKSVKKQEQKKGTWQVKGHPKNLE